MHVITATETMGRSDFVITFVISTTMIVTIIVIIFYNSHHKRHHHCHDLLHHPLGLETAKEQNMRSLTSLSTGDLVLEDGSDTETSIIQRWLF